MNRQDRPNAKKCPAVADSAARQQPAVHAGDGRPRPASALQKTSVRQWKVPPRTPQLIKVNERVYSATGYAISNVLYVITDTSVVVIDTTESPKAARSTFDEFLKVCQLPVSYIIYTHFHGDHIRGASVFHAPGTKVIAQKGMPEERERMIDLLGYRSRADALQFGATLDKQIRGISLACHSEAGRALAPRAVMERSQFKDGGYIPPDILFDEEYKFEEGGVSFELYHTQGETCDHLMVWLPNEKVLFPGDLFYSSFPMLGNPMKPDRPVFAWAESIERMRAFRPEYLVPSHSQPRQGAREIDEALANYAKAIRHVHDETIRLINQGLPLDAIRRRVKLPDELAKLPYLHQGYGKVDWAVVGVYRQNAGWYSFNPKELKPSLRGVFESAVLEASGGAEPLVKRARRALREGDPQLVLELTDVILAARPRHPIANELKTEALRRLGMQARNGVERNIYLTAARAAGAYARPRIDSANGRETELEANDRCPRKGNAALVEMLTTVANGGAQAQAAPAENPSVAAGGERAGSTPPGTPVFVLGLPRSFTSVICTMLGQHPEMYGFPELQLFLAETVGGWLELASRSKSPLADGALRVVAELYFGGQTAGTVKLARGWLRRRAHWDTGLLFEELAMKIRPRIPVDKTSIIVFKPESLRGLFRMFPEGRYIHLVRHPWGHGESVIKYLEERRKAGPLPPSHWLLRLASYPQRFGSERGAIRDAEIDPQRGWYALHQNVCEFLKSVPAAQQMRLRGEDLLQNPETVLREVADWIGVRGDAAAINEMLHPEHSPYACFGPPGARYGNDLFFLRDPALRPARAQANSLDRPLPWLADRCGFAPEVIELARGFGYE